MQVLLLCVLAQAPLPAPGDWAPPDAAAPLPPLTPQAPPPTRPRDEEQPAPAPAPAHTEPLEVAREPEPAEAGGPWRVVGAALGGLPGGLCWVPAAGTCCTAAAVMAAVYPLSRGDPVVQGSWPGTCFGGVVIGMVGWVLGLGTALVATGLVGVGVVVGGVLGWRAAGVTRARVIHPVAATLVTVVVTAPAWVLLAFLSGFLPWASVAAWAYLAVMMPNGGAWTYARWFSLNLAFMSAVAVGLGLVGGAAVGPLLAGLGGWTAGSAVAHGLE
ncbi:MAG: hypothetical protein HY904_01980 [Deltaproteobacteria bacterium]|nr:hypothetical protein [Deltaproteobacteria bacterium]